MRWLEGFVFEHLRTLNKRSLEGRGAFSLPHLLEVLDESVFILLGGSCGPWRVLEQMMKGLVDVG